VATPRALYLSSASLAPSGKDALDDAARILMMLMLAELTTGFAGSAGTAGGDVSAVPQSQPACSTWMETPAGCAFRTLLCEAGVLHAAVLVCADGERTAGTIIRSILFGHDGREGHGDPQAAAARRELASSLGAIEAMVELLQHIEPDHQAVGTPGNLETVLMAALQRVCMGVEENQAGAVRRARAAALGAVPAIVGCLDRMSRDSETWPHRLMNQGLETSCTIAGAGSGVSFDEEDKVIKAQWDSSIVEYPALQAKMQKAMMNALQAKMQQQIQMMHV
jgi:hypothetical protein